MLKYLLQFQPWSTEYCTKVQGLREDDKGLTEAVNRKLDLIEG